MAAKKTSKKTRKKTGQPATKRKTRAKKSTASRTSRKAAAAPASDETNAGGDLVVVRKYENRRLYDTNASKYINLERVAEMVREGVEVQVVEVKTGRDVTRQVLTQIIVESSREKGGPPLEFLRDLVRANDRRQRDFLQWYLSSAAEAYRAVRENWESAHRSSAERLKKLPPLWPPNPITQALQRALGTQPDEAASDDAPDQEPGPSTEDLQELRDLQQRLAKLEKRLAQDS